MNTWRQLNAPELVKFWGSIVNDKVMMGRDSHILKQALGEGLTTTQILYGMIMAKDHYWSIPEMMADLESWLLDDVLLADAHVIFRLLGKDFPPCYWVYLDCMGETEDQAAVRYLQTARRELEEFCELELSGTARIRRAVAKL